MAQGDVVFFDQFLVDALEGVHNLETDDIRIGLVNGTTVPSATTADPHWGGTGTTDFSTDENTGGNYTGPVALANPSVTLNGGQAEIDWDDPAQWDTNAANPTDVEFGIIYNNTHVNKKAIGYVDLGGTFDMTTGPLKITFGTPAATLNQA